MVFSLLFANWPIHHPAVAPSLPATLYPLSAVRLLPSPFTQAVVANRKVLLALDPDRLLAPFRREAGLMPKKPPYGNWESMGLDGHTAGHYLSALAGMVAAGHDGDGELKRRLASMIDELAECQKASPDGYVGGVPGSRELWTAVTRGDVGAVNGRWVPWYNLHKTYAGLRDAYLLTGNAHARSVLVRLADWAEAVTKGLSEDQMQRMLGQEHGGMNEVLADVYAITGDKKYLTLAQRFSHRVILDPLARGEDRLTGLHANTQIPKVIGFERIASLTGDAKKAAAARFFWDEVTGKRSVAFGGNSVSEHFNDPKDFRGLLEHREGPETCNTYNMLRLTEGLFGDHPQVRYVDYYERALYNHILASINTKHPGYVYFTPVRPGHYRVYSQPGQGFWCCVGTGMENPGLYGKLVYAKAKDGVYVNLFLPSELRDGSLTLRQETRFPDEPRTRLTLRLAKPQRMTLYLRHPGWVTQGFAIRVNGKTVASKSKPSSYAAVTRTWRTGDRVEIALPMTTTVERLPDGSDWVSILRGPIVLASPAGTQDQAGLFAGPGRGDHIAQGPLIPLDRMPVLLATPEGLPKHVVPDPSAGALRFRLKGVVEPAAKSGLPLMPFFRLQESRYQMVWNLTTPEKMAAYRARLAEEERAKIERDRATIDRVAPGEQQPEADHSMEGAGLDTGIHNGRRWRHGTMIRYVLDLQGEKNAVLEVTYSGDDGNRTFDIFANDVLIGTQTLKGDRQGRFFEVRYPLPAAALATAKDGKIVVRFVGKGTLAGGLYDVRLLRGKP